MTTRRLLSRRLALMASAILAAQAPGLALAAPACPAQDFPTFLAAFENDVAVQKAFVVIPLRSDSDSVDADAEPEPKPVTKMLGANDLSLPLMPSRSKQASGGLKQTRTAKAADDVQVKLFKPDTGMQITYSFRKEACWMLYRIEDDSL